MPSVVCTCKTLYTICCESNAGQEAEAAQQFSDYLLRVGDGREPTVADAGEDFIKVPDDMLEPTQTLEGLIKDIYGDLPQHHFNRDYLAERAILTLRNTDVDNINDIIMQSFPGEVCSH